jgi:hypothetical protein
MNSNRNNGLSHPTFTRHGHSTVGRIVSRPSTPSTTFRELKRAVFNGSHDHFSFRKVVGRHGAIMTELGQLLHSGEAPISQASLYAVYQKLAKLNAMWIRLICIPDDSIYAGTQEEDKYRETVSGMIDLFTNRLVSMLTDKDGEPNRHPPFDELLDTQSRFFCMLSSGRGDAHFTETRNQLCTYVRCLGQAWDTLAERGGNNDAHYVTSSDCIAAAMSLGSWLDTIIK